MGVGAGAGVALSPLPWKLLDDSSIWSQNWAWTPVPKDGEANYVGSVCTLCPAACGISVRKIDNRAVKIEGMKGAPVNDGGICILGLSGLQLLYGPTRIKAPLKRVGKREEGTFQTISWKEAVSEVVEKLEKLRMEGKSHTVAAVSGTKEGTTAGFLKRFLTAYGSPNFLHVPSMVDTYEMAIEMMHGEKAAPGLDIENANFILSFSSGMLDGWGSPVRMFKTAGRLKDKMGKIVQIESRMSNSATKADRWIVIKPGTEGVLALGLAAVILRESLYHKHFVDNFTDGFDQFKDFVLNGYAPDKVSGITGVSVTNIVALAREFAAATAPLAICGRGQGDTPGALAETMAVHALNALVGNINRRGGVWATPKMTNFGWGEVRQDAKARRGNGQKRIDGAGDGNPSDSLLNRLPEALLSEKPYGLEMLLVSEANPLFTMKNTEEVRTAFEKIGYIVSFSSYMDETAMFSDIILPNHHYLERYEVVTQAIGLNKPFVGLAKPVVKPLYHTRHTGDVILDVAKGLGGAVVGAFPWSSFEACLKETLGYRAGALVKNSYWVDKRYRAPDWHQAFRTASGKFEFDLSSLKKGVYTAPEGDASTYPMVLVPYDSIRLSNDYISNTPFMTKTVADTVLKGNDSFVEINPETAKQMKLAEGAKALLSTPKGKVTVKVHLSNRVGPDMVAMPKGLGHTGNDRYLAGKGVNANNLLGAVKDAASGLDAAWGIRAKIAKS